MKNYTVYFEYTINGTKCFGSVTVQALHAGEAQMLVEGTSSSFANFKITSVR